MKGDWIGNCIWCNEPIYEGYRHNCWVDKNGKIKVCDCDPDESPYPSCDECPWSDEELEEEARSMMGNRNVKKNAELHLKLPKELYEKLKELAERDERTMSYFIRKALKEYLEKLENLERKEVG